VINSRHTEHTRTDSVSTDAVQLPRRTCTFSFLQCDVLSCIIILYNMSFTWCGHCNLPCSDCSKVLSIAFGVDFSTVVIYFDSKREENPSWRMKQPVVVMSLNPAFVTNESGYFPLQRTAALGYLGVVDRRPWNLQFQVGCLVVESWFTIDVIDDGCVQWVTVSRTLMYQHPGHLLRKSLPRRSTFPCPLAKVIALTCIAKFSALIPEDGCDYAQSCLRDFPQSLQTNLRMTSQSRAAKFKQRGSHNSLRTRLTAALVYTYIEKWELNQIKRHCL
jgi:hypothetical protein